MVSTFIVLLLIGLDQVSKYYAVEYLQPIMEYPVINNFFYLTYVENRGAAFGILKDKKIFFVTITLIIVTVLFVLLYRQKGKFNLMSISLILIIGGAIGNLIDRIRFSYVIDFFDFKFFPAVFNVADIAIVVGTGLLCIYILAGGDFK
jgi:signal peptidase II